MLLRCDHIHLIAQDVERSVAWYCRVLGARISFQGQYRGSKVYYLELAGMTFYVFGQLESEPLSPPPAKVYPKYGVDHFGFLVDDLDATIAQVRSAGASVLEGPLVVRPGLRIAYIEGPDCIRIELSERK